MPSDLLHVKFFVPKPRPGLIVRPQLLHRFETGLRCPLTLISAPAGFGKSTLLSSWIADFRLQVEKCEGDNQKSAVSNLQLCWLSLDGGDNLPARFWTYTLAAVQTGLSHLDSNNAARDADLFEDLLSQLQSDPPPPIQPILERLINAIIRREEQILLVLDDYHEIQSPEIHDQMAYLLDHLPPNLRLVISTRTDPPLPVSRLRARGQLSEFRQADLRFTSPEAYRFFQEMLGLDLPAAEIQALEDSTEGWIAGLQMAALALQAQLVDQTGEGQDIQEKISAFIDSFSGKNMFILDYLADEVFNRQAEEIREFLLKTSVLDRMCAELCDKLIENREPIGDEHRQEEQVQFSDFPGLSAPSPAELAQGRTGGSRFSLSQEILTYLNASNLFLVQLDTERTWFRYHHLFADLLRARLDQTRPALKPALYIRASEWYEHQDSIEEAIRYALSAQDWDRAARLMEQHIQIFLERGYLARVLDWIARIPKEVSACRPRLSIQQTWVMGFAQRFKEFVVCLETATRLIQALDAGSPGCPPVENEDVVGLKLNLALMTAYHQIMLGNPSRALSMLEESYHRLPSGYPWEESWMDWMIGYAARAAGDLERATESLRLALGVCEGHDNLWNDMICYTDLAMVYHLRGQLSQARDQYLKAIELGRLRHAANHGYLNRVEGGLCSVLLDRNEVDAAILHGETGLELSLGWPSANSRVLIFTALGRARLSTGDIAGAAEVIQLADQERRKFPLLPINDALVDYSLVRLWLARGEKEAARQWSNAFRDGPGRGFSKGHVADESLELKCIALCRVYISLGEFDQALDLLKALSTSARQSKRIQPLIEICVLQAVALRGRKNDPGDPAACSALEEALALAQPGGYTRVFLDEGPQLGATLAVLHARYHPASPPAYSQAFLESLLGLLPQPEMTMAGPAGDRLPESLTEREREVLHLMASGLSNREMADKLVLSEGTIKTHVHNIIAKLDANSRTHAIALAKELKLIA